LGLRCNVAKTKMMICLPRTVRTGMSDAAHTRRMTGVGPAYEEQQKERVLCGEPNCTAELQRRSRKMHWRVQHGKEEYPWADAELQREADGGWHYRPNFYLDEKQILCPVLGCGVRSECNSALRNHFNIRHPYDTLAILREGDRSKERCPLCGTHVDDDQWRRGHVHTQHCKAGVKRRRQRVLAREIGRANERVFTVNGEALERVFSYCYLGRPLAGNNSDWPALFRNVKKAKMKWGQIARPLIKTGIRMRIVGLFYKAIVQAVLLYGCETWVITPDMLRVLESFHNRTARRIANMMPRLEDGVWFTPSVKKARRKAGLYTMEHYIRKRQNTIAEYIATRPIYEQCLDEAPVPPPGDPELPPRNSRLYRWWTQPTRTTEAPEEDDLEDDDSFTSEELATLQEALDQLDGGADDDVSDGGSSMESEQLFHLEALFLELARADDGEETDSGSSDVTDDSN
jgi:hypothetical protein